MIDITIKTLDSRNHNFSVDDELTVKQLKEHIAEPVNVPVESQRLIYCGRVLLDDKKLSEYDVNGKVIHLVQRAPPSSGNSGNNGNEGRATINPARRPWRTVINSSAARVDSGSNAMYLGAMAFPADLMDAQGITMPQPRHGLSQSRLSVARSMIRRARYTLQNLENPSVESNDAQTSNVAVNITEGMAIASQVLAAALTSASAASQAAASSANVEGSSSDQGVSHEEVVNTSDSSPQEPALTPSEEPQSQQQTPGGPSNGTGRSRYPGTTNLADLVMQIRDVNRRLQPFLNQYYELMRDDPVLENPGEAQRVFTQVSEMMHFIAHAYHALSDVMCDFSHPPPRFLRCRPVLIQHSAVLHTGFPIQVNVSPSQSNQVNSGNSQNQTGENAASSEASTNSQSASTPNGEETRPREEAPSAGPQPQSQSQSLQPSGPGVNIGPGNFEFYMDVGPSSITIDSVEATVVTSAGASNSESTGPITAGPYPWGTSPPPEILQNLMQAFAGQIIVNNSQAVGGMNSSIQGSQGGSSAEGTPPSGAASGASSAGTNSQARGNTATHPTTATQTRSTSRPHVHFAPGIQTGMSGQTFFDPFLPCNSHHIRGSRRRAQVQGTEQAEVQEQASQASTTSAPVPEPPPRHNNLEAILNLISGVLGAQGRQAGGGGHGQGPSVIRILPSDIMILHQGSQVQEIGNISSGTTVAELLQDLPDHSYTEGQSIFMDLFMAMARNLRVSEVLNMGSSTSNMLINLRPVLTEFIRERLLQGRQGAQAVTDAVDRINAELRSFLESIDVPMREDVDLIATINQLNHRSFPVMIRDVLEEDDSHYSRSIPNLCNTYARSVLSILLHCCQNGHQGLDLIFASFARRMIIGVPNALQNWSISQIVSQLRALSTRLDTNQDAIQPYLVYRMAEVPALAENQTFQEPPVPANNTTLQPQPMETETEPEVPLGAISEPETLPDVIIEAEPWHNTLPPEWVPIITRDRERQRRQAVQGPLSEAYLSGMPSKRRKVVASAKPHGTLARVISESMATALGAAGITSADGIADSAGADSSIRAAYRDQVRTSVEATLRNHPDYKPENYPNAAKYFDHK